MGPPGQALSCLSHWVLLDARNPDQPRPIDFDGADVNIVVTQPTRFQSRTLSTGNGAATSLRPARQPAAITAAEIGVHDAVPQCVRETPLILLTY